MNKNDLRCIKTEESIRNAFKKCVHEKGFEKTTVLEICKKAQISSNTFYAHYADKYFLLKKLFDEFEKTFFDYYDPAGIVEMLDFNPYRNTVSYVDAVIGTKDEMLFLMECSQGLMEETIYRVAIEYLFSDYVPDFQKRIGEPKAQLMVKYALGALVSFTNYWLHHDYDFTREEIIENLVEMSASVDRLMLKTLLGKS